VDLNKGMSVNQVQVNAIRHCVSVPTSRRRGEETLTLVAFTVGTYLVGLKFQQTFDSLLILSRLARCSATRHISKQPM
jgi:hypothetical protein